MNYINLCKSVLIFTAFTFVFFNLNEFHALGKEDVKLKDPSLRAQLVVQGLKSPTSMAFLDQNDLLVLEKNGVVKRIVGSSVVEQPVLDITSAVNNTRERGLLGIAIAGRILPEKDQSQKADSNVYLYFTENIPNDIHNSCSVNCTGPRVVNSLFVYDMKDNRLVNPKLLFSIPFGSADIGLEHIGGKIIVGPDERVYITGGDGYPCRDVQDCKNSVSKGILNSNTLNANGSSATGTGGILTFSIDGHSNKSSYTLGDDFPLNVYYAYGIRNSFGLDFDPQTGNLWDTENGPYFGDEINLVKPGFNSGWAKAQGIWSITDFRQLVKDLPFGYHYPKGNTPADRNSLYSYEGKGNYSAPEFTWYKSTGLTALKFFDSNRLGEQYKDDLFVGSFNKGRIYHFHLNEDRNTLATGRLENNVASSEMQLANFLFAKGFSPVTDIQVSPDRYLYVLTYEGTLWKISKSDVDN